jgi:hypothetical protein
MGWDNERYYRTKKDTFDISFIHFGISHSRFSDYRTSFINLQYPLEEFFLGYLIDIPKT